MSKICIIYRPLKHQNKQLRVTTKVSVDGRMPKTLTSPPRS